jgi:hypothetical protein
MITSAVRKEPCLLRGLDAAVYILESLARGETIKEIASRFDGDDELVKMWVSFLKHNHWMHVDNLGNIVVTEKASAYLHRRDLLRLTDSA